ncbi:MAG TPA: hypothetical protein VF062_06410 [Candidatus Limnocylindrales bacterium]
MLFFLAPLFGEFLLGNLKASEIFYVPFLAPLYGGGAVLIRELTRRAGRGYATMLTLGVAYTIVEEGLVDQLFFNPAYFAGQEQLMDTVIPGLGVDAWLTLVLFAMHAIWSICVPIILVEAIFADRGDAPWLGKPGLSVTAAIFVLGSLWLGHTIYVESGFMATVAQLAAAAVITVLLVAVAFAGNRRVRTPRDGFVPGPWIAGGAAFGASSLYMLTEYLPGWTRVAACVLIAVGFFALVRQWSRRAGWSPVHTLALAGGAILTYAWLGAVMEPETGPKTLADHLGTIVFICGALGLFVVAVRSSRRATVSQVAA